MPSNRRTSNECFEPELDKNMGTIEARYGSNRQLDSKIQEPVQLPLRTHRKSQTCVSQRTGKSSVDCQGHNVKRTAIKNDELVKHMSNLPKYLQHVPKQENSGANPLNVGVLDWGRLEKWKHTRKDSPTRGRNNVCSKSSSSFSKTTAKPVPLPSTGPVDPKAYKRKQFELSKKVSHHLETDDKRSNSLTLKTTAKSFAFPSKAPEDSLSVKSKQLEVEKKELRGSNRDDAHHQPGDLKDVVVLKPKISSRERTLGDCPQLSDETLTQAKPQDESTQKSVKALFEASRSGPVLDPTKCESETDMMRQGLEPLSDLSHSSFNSERKGDKLLLSKSQKQNKVELENTNNETLKVLDQEMAELANKRNRNPSGHHRFSFSLNLSRMSRSFSFKEGPVVDQLSSWDGSVKSGLAGSEASGYMDDINREKVKAQHRTRSSPFKRMLDPLRKPKSLNSLGFSEILQPQKGSLNSSNSRPSSASESLKKEKHDPSTIQALMQLTLKDGLPLFRFVVNNSNNILAASMNIPPSSGDDPMVQHYTFYSVNEIKKKIGSWISQGGKEKSCGFAYDVIGQMKISSSCISDVKDTNYDSLIRESVLFGVDHRQATQASQKLTCNIELGAVVVKTSKEELCHGLDCLQQSCKDTSTIVILPGGIHGLPNKGLPSPLIHRWRSGGSCDCGGWDVGCKLCILSEQNGTYKDQITCPAGLNPDCVELFVQGETRPQSKPIYSLALHKHGLYSIEFNVSLSALQAFFISVTVLCCQKSSDLLEASNLSKEKVLESVLNSKGSDGTETKPAKSIGKMPARYTPIPPLSPVGRV